jgi:hypothetical protein
MSLRLELAAYRCGMVRISRFRERPDRRDVNTWIGGCERRDRRHVNAGIAVM